MTRTMKVASIGLTMASLAIGLTGCAGTTTSSKSAAPAAAVESGLSGKVVETMDGGGYTYVLLEQGGKQTWAAIPATKVAVGDELKLAGGAEMPGFHSKALNRTFDMIIFSGGLQKPAAGAGAQLPTGHPSVADAKKAPAAPQKAVLAGKVLETIPAATYIYLLIEKDGEKAWSAIPTADVKVGDEVELIPGVDMGIFKSATLNRTFDSIHFSTGLKESKESKEKKAKKGAVTLPEGHPKTDAAKGAPGAAAMAAPITGKVVETVEGGGYTYLCLEKEGVKTWAAVPAAKVSVGQEVTLAPGNTMKNFESKTLKRTFESIIFTRMQ